MRILHAFAAISVGQIWESQLDKWQRNEGNGNHVTSGSLLLVMTVYIQDQSTVL